ncbi:hypothetical protein AB0M50_52980 [Nonomuraea fuscirosea]|uniref:hypothetical protein n=1 Tax=Nonomuraea fuscirosea TaxID=1291556 RepID=UPI002DDC7858|nr:hypothetical protein [Nonomuraea fuscirosea]WSA53626.1 hypothetical protein OIE67_03015 [Nonomuraea fuscirosea]
MARTGAVEHGGDETGDPRREELGQQADGRPSRRARKIEARNRAKPMPTAPGAATVSGTRR